MNWLKLNSLHASSIVGNIEVMYRFLFNLKNCWKNEVQLFRQAGMIGLMRNGRFLAEETPTKLMEMHRLETLEEVFLKLSKRQNLGLRRRSSILSSITGVEPEDVSISTKEFWKIWKNSWKKIIFSHVCAWYCFRNFLKYPIPLYLVGGHGRDERRVRR